VRYPAQEDVVTRRLDGSLVRVLVEQGLVVAALLQRIVDKHPFDHAAVCTLLLESNALSVDALRKAHALAWHVDLADIPNEPDSQAVACLPESMARTLGVVPLRLVDQALLVATSTPVDQTLLDELGVLLQRKVRPLPLLEVDVWRAFEQAYGATAAPRFRALLSTHALPMRAGDVLHPPVGDDEAAPSWDFSEALAHLASASTRDDVARVACRYAHQMLPFAAMFGVRQGACAGWLRLGRCTGEQFEAVTLPVPVGSFLQVALASPSPWVGRLADVQGNSTLLGWLGRPRAQTTFAMPIPVGGRVVAMLYADSGARGRTITDVAMLVSFASRIGPALERVVRDQRANKPSLMHEAASTMQSVPATHVEVAVNSTRPLPLAADEKAFIVDDKPSVWHFALTQTIEQGLQGGEADDDEPLYDEPTPIIRRVIDDNGWDDVQLSDLDWPTQPVTSSPMHEVPAASTVPVIVPAVLTAAPSLSRLVDDLHSTDDTIVHRAQLELVRAGGAAVPFLTDRFPGRLRADPFDAREHARTPAQLSSLLEVIAGIGKLALQAAIPHIDSRYPAHRYAAVVCFVAVPDARAIDLLRSRLHDPERRIRALALEALMPFLAHPRFESLLHHLRERLQGPLVESRERALELLGRFRDVGAVPSMMGLVAHPQLGSVARDSLRAITLQDFGAKPKAWDKWWQKAKKRTRIDWLLEGLLSDELELREASVRELAAIVGSDFGYRADGEQRDRERACAVFMQWWIDNRPTMQARVAVAHTPP
jgi:hypothetical protein